MTCSTRCRWFVARLREPSTYKGLAMVAAAFGIGIDPESVYQVASLLVGFIGTVNVVQKEPQQKTETSGWL